MADYTNVKFVTEDTTPADLEIPTLINLKNICDSSTEEFYVLYIHHKGVTKTWSRSVSDWRDMLNYFNISNWKICIDKLYDGFDTVGVNWNGDYKYPHYAGNFWWAKSSYIKKLPKLVLPSINQYRTQLEVDYEYHKQDAEFWLGMAIPKASCLHHSNINHYEDRYNSYMYRDDVSIPVLYNNIPGSFNSEDMKFYKQIVDITGDYSHFIEINPEGGKSTAYMTKYFSEQKKNITLDVLINSENYEIINKNLETISSFYNPLINNKNITSIYSDESIDFIFIYHSSDEGLRDDILSWLPKVRSGGIIAGYNFFTEENARCVSEIFSEFEVRSCCWYKIKE